MKTIKGRYDLILHFFVLFTLLAFIAYFFFLRKLENAFMLNWIFDSLLILLFCLPHGSIAFGKEKTLSTINWLLILFSCQLILNLIFWGMPFTLQETFGNSPLFPMHFISSLSLTAGFFPFGFMTLFALSMAYFAFTKGAPGLLSSTYQPLFGNSHLDSIGITVDSYMRLIPLVCVAISLLMVIINLIILIEHLIGQKFASGVNLTVIMFSSSLSLAVCQKSVIRFLHKLSERFSLFLCLLLFSLVLVSTYIIIHFILQHLSNFNHSSIRYIMNHPQSTYRHSLVLISFWWLAYSTLVGGIIAWVSSGRTIRQTIAGLFVTQVFVWIVIFLIESLSSNLQLPFIISIICHVIVLSIILKKQNFTYFIRATLPFPHLIKPRSSFRFLSFMPIILVSGVSAYLAISVFFLSFDAVIGFLPCLMIIVIGYIGFFKDFLTIK